MQPMMSSSASGDSGDSGDGMVPPAHHESSPTNRPPTKPVTNLELPLHGINALFTNNGYNCLDGLSLQGYLGNQPIGPVRFEQLSASVKKRGVGLTGIANNPVSSDTSTYDEGSVRVIASKKLDRIVLTQVQNTGPRIRTPDLPLKEHCKNRAEGNWEQY